jgi:phosphotriesterase-related protein
MRGGREADEPEYRIRTVNGFTTMRASGGHVLPHEHILVDSRVWWEGQGDWRDFDSPELLAATSPSDLHATPQALTRENMLLSDWYLGARELRLARDVGAQLVVDLTVLGTGPAPELAARAAALAGLALVVPAGRYLRDALAEEERSVDEDSLVDRWTDEIDKAPSGRIPGIIGEIGTSFDINDTERTSLRAAGRVQSATGLPLNVHVHPFGKKALEAIGIATEAGADPQKIAISHLDCEIDLPQMLDILATGALVEFDNFGTSRARFVNGSSYPDDEERLDLIEALVENGRADRILLSHDINHRNSLIANGGWGYAHLGRSVLPELVARFGPDVATILTARNPLNFLHIDPDHERRLGAEAPPHHERERTTE